MLQKKKKSRDHLNNQKPKSPKKESIQSIEMEPKVNVLETANPESYTGKNPN